jgi:hypothetical protein
MATKPTIIAGERTHKKSEQTPIEIIETEVGELHVSILGLRPLINYRMSAKSRGQLLYPAPPKNRAEKAATQKHDPREEFQASPYRISESFTSILQSAEDERRRQNAPPTLLAMPAANFKKALACAALDLPGLQKSQIGRLTWVQGDLIPVFGIPKLFMSVVRNSDMNHTPDIRTRCIIPEWCCNIVVTFVKPLMRANSILKLLTTAGLTMGMGDWRPQKGSGTYGQFKVVAPDDPDFKRIMSSGGRSEQEKAMAQMDPYDDETAELLTWFDAEMKVRRAEGKAA